MEVEVGHMDAGTPLQFKVLARAQCHLLGAPQFAEALALRSLRVRKNL